MSLKLCAAECSLIDTGGEYVTATVIALGGACCFVTVFWIGTAPGSSSSVLIFFTVRLNAGVEDCE